MIKSSPPVMISLLGPFAARHVDGAELDLPKKAQALLAFLLINKGRWIGRDELSALLWSNTGSEQARQSLRQCVSVLRKTLPDAASSFVARGDALVLDPATTLLCDVAEWERLEKSPSLADLSTGG